MCRVSLFETCDNRYRVYSTSTIQINRALCRNRTIPYTIILIKSYISWSLPTALLDRTATPSFYCVKASQRHPKQILWSTLGLPWCWMSELHSDSLHSMYCLTIAHQLHDPSVPLLQYNQIPIAIDHSVLDSSLARILVRADCRLPAWRSVPPALA
jgi:hypothetical protein